MTWVDKLKKVKPNIMTLKIQKDVEKYKVGMKDMNFILFLWHLS